MTLSLLFWLSRCDPEFHIFFPHRKVIWIRSQIVIIQPFGKCPQGNRNCTILCSHRFLVYFSISFLELIAWCSCYCVIQRQRFFMVPIQSGTFLSLFSGSFPLSLFVNNKFLMSQFSACCILNANKNHCT